MRIEAARTVLEANDIPWAVAGGWAIDLVLGHETREHADLDLAIWPRPTDEADFCAALPALATEQREWLRLAITRSSSTHPWLHDLG